MGNKINVAQLLKDCPQGMELDCIMYENLYFDYISNDKIYPIWCYTEDKLKAKHPVTFTWYGRPSQLDSAKCVIYPKGKNTWEGFVPPCKFKDGDILYVKATFDWICIYKESEDTENVYKYVAVLRQPNDTDIVKDTNCLCCRRDISEIRIASEEEKQKLFDVIKANGYRWNSENKTLEKMVKPKFKVGDRIKNKTDIWLANRTIKSYDKNIGYFTTINDWVRIEDQDNWELVPNKFDINTLVSFESKVLIRDSQSTKWLPAIWGFYNKDNSSYPYEIIGGNSFSYCIPYEGNEHLRGTTNDCDDYYKDWE